MPSLMMMMMMMTLIISEESLATGTQTQTQTQTQTHRHTHTLLARLSKTAFSKSVVSDFPTKKTIDETMPI